MGFRSNFKFSAFFEKVEKTLIENDLLDEPKRDLRVCNSAAYVDVVGTTLKEAKERVLMSCPDQVDMDP